MREEGPGLPACTQGHNQHTLHMHTQEGGGQGEGGKEGERVKGGGKKECKKEGEAKSKATTQ